MHGHWSVLSHTGLPLLPLKRKAVVPMAGQGYSDIEPDKIYEELMTWFDLGLRLRERGGETSGLSSSSKRSLMTAVVGSPLLSVLWIACSRSSQG